MQIDLDEISGIFARMHVLPEVEITLTFSHLLPA